MSVPRFNDLAAARRFLVALDPDAATPPGPWSASEVLQHCAQSIEMSIDGFPRLEPALVRATIGKWVGRRFLARGRLGHDLGGAIPGAPALDPAVSASDARDGLVAAIDRFLAHEGPLAPHFVFGALDRDAFERMHALHLADHFEGVAG